MNKSKELKTKLFPWMTNEFLCKMINPFLQIVFNNISPKKLLHKKMNITNVEYLNLGSFRPV